MGSAANTPVRDRHAFRPDLREAELEDRPLMAISLAFPIIYNGTQLFNVFNYMGPAGPSGIPGGGGGPSASIPLGAIAGPGSGILFGINTGAGGASLNFLNIFQSQNANTAAAQAALSSAAPLLSLATSLAAAIGGGPGHNAGPIALASVANASVPGFGGTTFSSGGNFAASYSGTYNGFTNAVDPYAVQITAPPLPPQAPNQPPGPGQGAVPNPPQAVVPRATDRRLPRGPRSLTRPPGSSLLPPLRFGIGGTSGMGSEPDR